MIAIDDAVNVNDSVPMHALVAVGSDVALTAMNDQTDVWYLDSGVTSHMASSCAWFTSYMWGVPHEADIRFLVMRGMWSTSDSCTSLGL